MPAVPDAARPDASRPDDAPFDALRTITTFGDLKAAGYRTRPVKDELRANMAAALRASAQTGEPLFPGILGYDESVVPAVANAILARHDLLLLGLRGQAKTRLVRSLPRFLDPVVPYVAGSEVHDDPFRPFSKMARELLADLGDDAPIAWLERGDRYGEKLATPDTTMADLLGDVDPIKAAARKLTYADEDVLHFGLIPRTNRGNFCIKELPDLQPRIQVGLFNILEEQDVQIRGFRVRFPLDVLMVFTANPEDYTNRGAIITPLKDRIDAQITTHYPKTLEIGVEITRQEAWTGRAGDGASGVSVAIPHVVREVVEQAAIEARASDFVDQKSGVSARLTRSALETLVSAAERRALIGGEAETVVRMSDFAAIEPALTGKLELVYEGEQTGAAAVAQRLVGQAVRATLGRHFPDPADTKGRTGGARTTAGRASSAARAATEGLAARSASAGSPSGSGGRDAYREVLAGFSQGLRLTLDPALSNDAYAAALTAVPGLAAFVDLYAPHGTPMERAAMMEFVLEGLHQHSLLGKEREADGSARYADLVGAMFAGFTTPSTDDDDLSAYDDPADDTPPRRRR